uniref:protein-tyrosine-phosphatase n=2 Tax=Culex tarsalis TaxID=7177 RepID=A0A1Q3G4R6_CULTA
MMELRDVPESSIFSSSSLATQNRIQNGIPLLLISFRKQSNSFRKHSSNVNSHPESLLQSVQYSDYPDHSYQSDIYHHISNPVSENVKEHNSVSITKSWPEDKFYTFIAATITSIGIFVTIVWLVFWLKNNVWRRREISSKKNKTKALIKEHFVKMDENEDKLWEASNVNTCLQITVTDTESHAFIVEDTLTADNDKSRNEIKETSKSIHSKSTSRHMNKSQLETGLIAHQSSQQKKKINCEEKKKSHKARKQRITNDSDIPLQIAENCENEGECSFSYLEPRKNRYEGIADVETTKPGDFDQTIASIQNESHLREQTLDPNSEEIFDKQSPINLGSDKDSPNNSDTSSSFTFIPLYSACETNKQFTFSPKMVNEYKTEESSASLQKTTEIGSKNGNSYYRFPDVDTFTPPTIQNEEKTSKRISLIYPCISPKQAKQKVATNLPVPMVEQMTNSNSYADTGQAGYHGQNNSCLSDRASRRARLKSISLDSEGARLVEENLSSGIPVEELVERAANPVHYSNVENQSQSSKMASRSSSASCRKHRNILNLKLNLNDKDKTLPVDEEYRLNDFFFEYYDYEDEDEAECRDKLNRGACHSEKHPSQFSQKLQPKTPTLNLTREKANSLDSDQYLNYMLPSTTQVFYGAEKEEQPASGCSKKKSSTASIRISSLSVPTTPKRSMQSMRTISNDQSVTNLRTLPEVSSCSFAERQQKKITIDNPSKSRSSILQRRGSNHSLTLNLEAPSTLTKGLSASNFSLGNHKGSYHNLVSSSNNLNHQQSDQQTSHTQQPVNVQNKKNLLQRRGSNTSLVLNLQGSTNSLNRYNSHNSLNIHNQHNNRPLKKGLIERRNSNTSLTLFNVQNPALSVSNCNLPGSNCSLNSMVTYQTQNEGMMLEEDEHQVASNNNQNYCGRVDSCAANESRLSLSCAQHASRRKFLSSDSIHNIARSRASMENLRISHNRETGDSCCGSNKKSEQPIKSFSNECACSTNTNAEATSSSMFKLKSATASTNNLAQYNNCECCRCNCTYTLSDGMNSMNICNANVRKITTKPLSPQTTSEDFKIYLANIQFLQNASNFLSDNYMKNLHLIFNGTYGSHDKSRDTNVLTGENNDVKLTNLSMVRLSPNADRSKISETDEKQKKMILKIHQEFWDLPTNYQEKPLVFGSQSKNRYKTILPNEHSRVILSAEPDSLTEPYINANFIKGPDYTVNSYIATQGPMSSTIFEFWLMVYQNVEKAMEEDTECLINVKQKIIMLTDFVENSRQKCAVYFPQQLNESMVFTSQTTDKTQAVLSRSAHIVDDIQTLEKMQISRPTDTDINFNYFLITNLGLCLKNGYSMRKLLVIYSYQAKCENLEICNAFEVYHYWFPDWPDHRSPEDIDVLLDISLDILDNDCVGDFESKSNPSQAKLSFALPIIHCSAGIGRTGCLLAILNGLSQIRSSFNVIDRSEDQTKRDDDLPNKPSEMQQRQSSTWISTQVGVDILGIVCNLRLQRGGMVQNSEQYELIHRTLCLYMQSSGRKTYANLH